jgi:hypothetical protein
LAKALDKIQGEEQAYLGSLLPIIAALIMMLQYFDNRPLVYCRPLVEALQNGMKKRFGKLMDDLDVLLAAAFHPQFRSSAVRQLEGMEGEKRNCFTNHP